MDKNTVLRMNSNIVFFLKKKTGLEMEIPNQKENNKLKLNLCVDNKKNILMV